MRTLLLACATGATLLTSGLGLPTQANAMPVAPIAAAPRLDHVAYWCPPVWRCGPFGCGWRSFCGWRGGPYAFAPAYGWGWRPFYRPFYRPWAYRFGYRRFW